jgi:hypothetical protein
MSRSLILRILTTLALGGLVTPAVLDCHAASYVTCTGLCESVLPCNDTYNQCIDYCDGIQRKCRDVGQVNVFSSFVSCATDAGFSCSDAGEPLVNAACLTEQAALIQCQPDRDGELPFPDGGDGSLAAGSACGDAGSCLDCCRSVYPRGAKEYAAAVNECACAEDGGPCIALLPDGGVPCGAKSACSKSPVMPSNGDSCDLCLSAVLADMNDAGACVVPVTEKCNSVANIECAAYLNCVSQPGCTN